MKDLDVIEYRGKFYHYAVTKLQNEDVNLSLWVYSDRELENLIDEQNFDIPFMCRDTLADLIKRS